MIEEDIADTDRVLAKQADPASSTSQQAAINDYFKAEAHFWKDVYGKTDVYAVIHQRRRAAVCSLVDGLHLPAGSQVLDVGCGAGSLSVALASRSLCVRAVDPVPKMIELTRQAAFSCGMASNVTASLGDVHNLALPDNSFTLVVAIGVLPWLTGYMAPLHEIARVLQPGGYLIVNVDNRWGLSRLLDPGTNFVLTPMKLAIGQTLRRLHLRKRERQVFTTMVSAQEFKSSLRACGFKTLRGATFGFGPLSVFGHHLLPGWLGLKVNDALQDLCDRGFPFVRSMGAQYMVLAQKQ